MSRAILVVEDSIEDKKYIEAILREADFSNLSFAASYKNAVELIENNSNFDAVLIDINLNDNLDGITLAATIDREFHLPYVFVTGQHIYNGNRIYQDVAELKCRNFVTKPINEDDLISNLQIAIRSYKHYVQIAHNATYDLRNKIVKIDNEQIHLTQNQIKLLDILAKNMNRFVKRDAIRYHIWEDSPPKARNHLRQLKYELLKELEDNGTAIDITTHIYKGYKLVF